MKALGGEPQVLCYTGCMKYFLWGDDSLAIRFRKNELVKNFVTENQSAQVLTFDFSQGEKGMLEALEEALLPALFEVPKIIVVVTLETCYDQNKERVENILSSSANLIFVEYQKLAKTSAFLKTAKKHIEEEEHYDTKKRDTKKFIAFLERDLGGSLDVRALTTIQERSGKDDELLLQNIQKVITYTGDRGITAGELDILVPAPVETKIFDALDALAAGQKEKAFSLFHLILKEEDIFRIFPLCAWQIRQMLLVTEGKEQFGENKEKIAKDTGMHPFVVQKLLRVLPHFPRPRLAKGLRILAELDVALKQGRKTPEGALQHFVFQW